MAVAAQNKRAKDAKEYKFALLEAEAALKVAGGPMMECIQVIPKEQIPNICIHLCFFDIVGCTLNL
jgi:hypothetical protein